MEQNDVCQECLRHYNSGKTGGLNCAEATLKGLTDYLGLESDAVFRIATPFGGGIGRNGYICGSLVSGLMVLGLEYGRTDFEQERAPAYDHADGLLKKFVQKYGSVNCREITDLGMKDEQQVSTRKEDVHQTICRPLVANVCQWVTEMVEGTKTEAPTGTV